MFSSIFSTSDPNAQNFHAVTDGLAPADLYGELTPEDLHWECPGGFATETHIWYQFLDDGSFLMCQVIHSSAGLWYPTVQFTFRFYNPTTGDNVWRSVNVSGFKSPMPGSTDKTTGKSDHFTVDFKAGADGETYIVTGSPADDVQVSLTVTKTASGFKIGKGPQGGHSYFGADKTKPDGYVFHKFWPATKSSGSIVIKGKAIDATGTGMFVHATQGMRPDKVATRWNFARFQSPEQGGITATMMEFTTTPDYGKKGQKSGGVIVNVGGLVVGGKLVAVTAETRWPGDKLAEGGAYKSRAFHYDTKYDPDTTYHAPTRLSFHWGGPSIGTGPSGDVKADLELNVGDPASYTGLVEKIDVLGEIPKLIKTAIAYTAGAKPYIYAFYNPGTLTITLPSGETINAQGQVFNEASFVS